MKHSQTSQRSWNLKGERSLKGRKTSLRDERRSWERKSSKEERSTKQEEWKTSNSVD